MKYAIQTEQLSKSYRGKRAVSQLSLKVPAGKIYGFLGPNGAGKSTTMKMLLGLARPDSGSITILGETLDSRSRLSILEKTGSLIEAPSYYANLTGYENLKITCILKGLPLGEISRVLGIVRMEAQKDKKAGQYSLGMKQRLAIANALLGSPRLLLLDEPTNGLDPAGIHEMRDLIRSLPEKYGMTVMLSSHLLSEIEQAADYVGIISAGRMIYQNRLSALRASAARHLLLQTAQPAADARFLRESLQLEPEITESGIRLPFSENDLVAEMVRRLAEHGSCIYRIREEEVKLEDIYLSMVKNNGL